MRAIGLFFLNILLISFLFSDEFLFKDESESQGLIFTHDHGGSGEKYYIETMGSGVCLLDYDNDKDLDVFFCQGAALPGWDKKFILENKLFRNDGGRWMDVTTVAGIGDTSYSIGCACGDVDNDGDADDSDKFLHKKRKAVSKAMKKEDDEDESKVKENGKIDNKIKMEPEEEKMKESTGVAFVRKYKNKISETNEETSLQDQILELFRSSYASIDGEPVGAEFAVSDEPASASTIARTLRCSPTEVQKLLDDMVQAGQITRVGAVSYTHLTLPTKA